MKDGRCQGLRIAQTRSLSAGAMALCAVLLNGCAADRPASHGFDAFWGEFRQAVGRDDENALRSLTRFPFLYEGEPHGPAEFGAIYTGLFDARARGCFSSASPVAEDGGYHLYCGSIIYVFAQDSAGWRFTEFVADPEAEEGEIAVTGSSPAAGTWHVVRRFAAPWTGAGSGDGGPDLQGVDVSFEEGQVVAPAPLGCAGAQYTFVVSPAEGLFQGRIPEQAQAAARELGVQRLPVLTLRVDCDTGSFDYHYIERGVLLTALDDAVWRLEADASPDAPHQVVFELLTVHMTGDMGFNPERVDAKRQFLTPELHQRMMSYFDALDTTEPPPINGDPFTDSQEYPQRFQFGAIGREGSTARVRVLFLDGYRTREVVMVVRQVNGTWLVDDLEYERGTSLRDELAA